MAILEETWPNHVGRDGALWFRGHAHSEWKLLPGLTRDGIVDEREVQRIFESEALPHLPRPPMGGVDGDLEWLFLQQHHRAPTRLLDWTTNVLVGLHFAVEPHLRTTAVRLKDPDSVDPHDLPDDVGSYDIDQQDSAGCLWVMDPAALNRASGAHAGSPPNRGVPFWPRDVEAFPYYQQERIMDSRDSSEYVGPYAFYSRRTNIRMVVQSAAFTIFDLTDEGLDQWGPDDAGHIQKIIISPEGKEKIRAELQLMGINTLRLFPTLDSVGDHARLHAGKVA